MWTSLGIIHLDGVAYDVVVEGEITEADGKAEYDATLKEIKHPERQAKGQQVNDVVSDVSPGAGNSEVKPDHLILRFSYSNNFLHFSYSKYTAIEWLKLEHW